MSGGCGCSWTGTASANPEVVLAELPTGHDPVGARYPATSGGLGVLMDQPTEPISTYDPPSRHHDRWLARPERGACPRARCGRCTL